MARYESSACEVSLENSPATAWSLLVDIDIDTGRKRESCATIH